MVRKKKVIEEPAVERLEVIPPEGLPEDLAQEMLEDLSERAVMLRAMNTLKSAVSVLKVRIGELDERADQWGTGRVPPASGFEQLELYRSLGDKFRWLDELSEVRGYWKQESKIHEDYNPDWVDEAKREVEQAQDSRPPGPEDQTLPFNAQAGTGEASTEPQGQHPQPEAFQGSSEPRGSNGTAPSAPPAPEPVDERGRLMAELARLEALAWEKFSHDAVELPLKCAGKALLKKQFGKVEAELQKIRDVLEPKEMKTESQPSTGGGEAA